MHIRIGTLRGCCFALNPQQSQIKNKDSVSGIFAGNTGFSVAQVRTGAESPMPALPHPFCAIAECRNHVPVPQNEFKAFIRTDTLAAAECQVADHFDPVPLPGLWSRTDLILNDPYAWFCHSSPEKKEMAAADQKEPKFLSLSKKC